MYLTKIKIDSLETDVVIRDINFLSGLNLVVDSGKDQLSGSGNDIGKTTFLRSIDFCLGSAVDELYFDRDEKKQNTETLNFLINQKISFTLSIGYSIGKTDIVVKRWFDGIKKEKPIVKQSINNEEMGIRAYTSELNRLFFEIEEKPTFRELIPKFIREEKNSTGSLLRYHGTFKSHEEYNSIHLVLFGFKDTKILQKKSILTKEQKELENKKNIYIQDYGQINTLKSQIAILENDIDSLINQRNLLQKKLLDISNLETDLDTLNNIAKEITHVNSIITQYEIDTQNIQNNIKRLKEESADIDLNSIKLLYKESKLYSDSLQKDFEDVVEFHNKMIVNKINFSKKALLLKESKLQDVYNQRKKLVVSYKLRKTGKEDELFEELNILNDNILRASNHLEVLKNALKHIEDSEDKLKIINTQLEEISVKIKNEEEALQNNINIFNRYFTGFTKKLYNEEYFIYMGKNLLEPFEINTKFNPGDGKKKALIIAFDLAYAAFVSEVKLGYPKFIAEDQVELIDVKQLEILFDIAQNIDCQLIIPVLKSKIDTIEIDKKSILLTLSEEEKFFKF